MKNIQAQYQDLLEGKMSKANFMRNVRMQFPQHISPNNSFEDSVRILKGKRILSEAQIQELSPELRRKAYAAASNYNSSDVLQKTKRLKQMTKFGHQVDPEMTKKIDSFFAGTEYKGHVSKTPNAIFVTVKRIVDGFTQDVCQLEIHKDTYQLRQFGPKPALEEPLLRKLEKILKYVQASGELQENNLSESYTNPDSEKFSMAVAEELEGSMNLTPEELEKALAYLDRWQYELQGDFANNYEVGGGSFSAARHIVDVIKSKNKSLNEAKQPIGVYGHNPNAEAEKSRGIDHLNYYQVYRGLQYELAKMPEITDENYVKARKKVVDAILKNPDAYKDLQLANYKAVKEMDEDLEMKEVKKNNLNDKPNEMKVVKKDVKGNTQDSLGKKEAKKSKNGKGVQHMTQAPKGKLEAFPTPGKEKVMALKEHLLDELMEINPTHEYINVGSRVKKKGTKEYDESKVGNVTEFDGDTATVKWDNGSTEHVQINILTKKEIPAPKDTGAFGRLPDLGTVKEDPAGQQAAGNPEDEKEMRDTLVKREDKIKSIKEKMVKAVKELLYRDQKTQRVQSFKQDDPITKDPEFTKVFKRV